MITKLTSEQEALMPEYVKKYTDIGLSTKQVSKERTEEIIHQVYKAGKVLAPKLILHVDSPLAVFYAYALLEELQKQGVTKSNVESNVESNVRSNVWSNVVSNVRSNVESNVESNVVSNVVSNVRSNVVSNIRSNVVSNVESNIVSNVVSNVWSNVESNIVSNVESNVVSNVVSNVRSNVESNVVSNVVSNVRSNVVSNIRSNVVSNIRSNVFDGLLYGSHSAGWLSFYSFMYKELKLKIGEIAGLLNSLELGWFYAGSEVCIVSAKPVEMHLNDRGRLHCTDGMAVKYADGYGLYALDGQVIPEYVFESKLIFEKIEAPYA